MTTRERLERILGEIEEAGVHVSISEFARIAGISASTVHNCYPDLKKRLVRFGDAHDPRKQTRELKTIIRKLRREIETYKHRLRDANSVNAALAIEIQSLRDGC